MIIHQNLINNKQKNIQTAVRTYLIDGIEKKLEWVKQGPNTTLSVDGGPTIQVTDLFDTANTQGLEPTPKPIDLNKIPFFKYVYEQLGGPLTGAGRFGAVIKAARASTNDNVVGAMEMYNAATAFNRDETAELLGLFASLSLGNLTEIEVQRIYDNWPME